MTTRSELPADLSWIPIEDLRPSGDETPLETFEKLLEFYNRLLALYNKFETKENNDDES